MKSKLQTLAENYQREISWMAKHGWTQTAYTAHYGTTESPTLGDGGPLIWEADFNVYLAARTAFLSELGKWIFRCRKLPALAEKLLHKCGTPQEIEDIISFRIAAQRLLDSMRTSCT
jgi:hypothetical protein